MMFMMPIPPTSSDTPAMLARRVVIVFVVSVCTLAISSSVRTMKSSESPGWILWRVRRVARMVSAVFWISPALAADTVMLLMLRWPCSFFMTVVYGTKMVSS